MYVKGNASLEGRILFASVGEKDPGAAFFKLNNPVRSHSTIQNLVKNGFMVRTRADSDTREARKNETMRRDKALSNVAPFFRKLFVVNFYVVHAERRMPGSGMCEMIETTSFRFNYDFGYALLPRSA